MSDKLNNHRLLRWSYDSENLYSTTGKKAFCTNSYGYVMDGQGFQACQGVAAIITGDVRYVIEPGRWFLVSKKPYDPRRFQQLHPLREHDQINVYHPDAPIGTRSLMRWSDSDQSWLFAGEPGNGTPIAPSNPQSVRWKNAQVLTRYTRDAFGNVLTPTQRLSCPAPIDFSRKVAGVPVGRFLMFWQTKQDGEPDPRWLMPNLFQMREPAYDEAADCMTPDVPYPKALPVPDLQEWRRVIATPNGYQVTPTELNGVVIK